MPINIIYASTSGNVEIVCETIAKLFNKRGIETVLSRVEQTPIEVISKNSHFLFATSTWEHGKLNPFFDKLYGQMEKLNFQNKKASFVGLGDKRYEPVLFCEGIEIIKRLWSKNGGGEVGPTLLVAGEPYEKLNTNVESWADKVIEMWV